MTDRRWAANLSLLFTEAPLLDRPALAAGAGFAAVEMWWPFPTPEPTGRELDDLLDAVDAAGVPLVGLNFFAGDMPAGDRGVACDPSRGAELAANASVVADVADRTGCRRFNLLYGKLDPDADASPQHEAAADAIAEAAQALSTTDAVVLLEPLARDLNGTYPLHTLDDVVGVLDGPLAARGVTTAAPLYDTFHLAMNGVDLVEAARTHAARVGHVQIADAPGRGAPGTGEAPIAAALDALRAGGYTGWVAAEYAAADDTPATLAWMSTL
jgi:hydroxypyruvate isomerase